MQSARAFRGGPGPQEKPENLGLVYPTILQSIIYNPWHFMQMTDPEYPMASFQNLESRIWNRESRVAPQQQATFHSLLRDVTYTQVEILNID